LIALNKVKDVSMSLLMILVTIFLPPVAVGLKQGIGVQFLINIVLTLIGWLPGVIHAFWVNTRGGETLASGR
jgi:uncharacterized membrane protein YqaE (UPF0057 family)